MPEEDALKRELFDDLFAVADGVAVAPPSQPLSPEDVRLLSPGHFEALVAAVEERDGARVLLTPHSLGMQASMLLLCSHKQYASFSANTPAEISL